MVASNDSQWLLDGLNVAIIRRPRNVVYMVFITGQSNWPLFYIRYFQTY